MSVSLDIHGTVTDDALAVGVCPMTPNQRAAENLTFIRKMRGMTQQNLAFRLTVTGRPVSKQAVSAWERSVTGKRVWAPDLNLLTDIAFCLDVPLIAFLADLGDIGSSTRPVISP